MENIERTQFVVLTGHLDDQPLPDLMRRLRAQRKSGRLQVEYTDAPGSFFFEDGQLVDAQLGTLRGVEAIYAALSLTGASFNFNPLVRPPERNIDRQEQQFIRDLIEAPRRENLTEIKVAGRELGTQAETRSMLRNEPRQLPPGPAELIAPLEDRLTAVEAAIVSTSRRFSRERLIYACVISLLIGLISVIFLNAFFGPLFVKPSVSTKAIPTARKPDAAVAAGAAGDKALNGALVNQERDNAASVAGAGRVNTQAAAAGPLKKTELTPGQSASPGLIGMASAGDVRGTGGSPSARRGYVVRVLLEVRSGQVTDASVLNPRDGAGAYESLAVELAKQRRYPENFNGSEKVKIRVKP